MCLTISLFLTSILNPRPSAYTVAELIMSLISGLISLLSASSVAYLPNTKATVKNPSPRKQVNDRPLFISDPETPVVFLPLEIPFL